jgi:hypothetical protein
VLHLSAVDPATNSPPVAPGSRPAATLLPLMPADGPEFGALVADLHERGPRQPIVLHDGRILGGLWSCCGQGRPAVCAPIPLAAAGFANA